ncbi:MAG: hypothetical protein V1857_07315 [archaeon]
MGGAKKKGLAQMEKTQTVQQKPATAPKKKDRAAPEKKLRGVDLPSLEDQKTIGEIRKMGSLTPFAVASQFNIRISAAKDLLEELERKRVVEAVGGNARVRIYKAVAA